MRKIESAVIHGAGRWDLRLWKHQRFYFPFVADRSAKDETFPERGPCPADLSIVLCHNYTTKPIVERSLDRLGVDNYVVVGRDIRQWQNVVKIDLMLDYLENHCTTPYVMFLDAFDVWLTHHPKEVLERFKTHFDCGVLLNAERNSFPPSTLFAPGQTRERIQEIERFEEETYPPPFVRLNSGCYIGKRESVLSLFKMAASLKDYFPSWTTDDQALVREAHRRLYPEVQIDHKCVIFQNYHQIRHGEIRSRYIMPAWAVPFELVKALWTYYVVAEGRPSLLRRGWNVVKLVWKRLAG